MFLYGSQCARLPLSNNPVTNVASNDVRCNAGTSAVGKKCAVAAGATVTVEMHQVRHTALTRSTRCEGRTEMAYSNPTTAPAAAKPLAVPTTVQS